MVWSAAALGRALVLLAVLTLTAAGGAGRAAAQDKPLSTTDKRVHAYVVANTAWTLYHELGHALVDLYDVPVLGREEDAADQLAVMLMLDQPPGLGRDRMLIDAAWYWYYAGRFEESRDYVFWDVHSLSLQRFFQMICMIYGSDPDRFELLAKQAGMPRDAWEGCVDGYDRMVRSWTQVLEPHAAVAKSGARVLTVFDPPGPGLGDGADMVAESGLADAFAKDVQSRFHLPESLTVKFTDCGAENAYYSWWDRTITMCHEELEHFIRQITAGGRSRPPDPADGPGARNR